MKLYIINGPNLNMLGIREPGTYGSTSYNDMISMIDEHCESNGITPVFYQSNSEGGLVDKIQEAYFEGADGIIINPGAYTHTSIAILDAIKATSLPAVEVHISNLAEREDFRQISYVRAACKTSIIGHGIAGYLEAVDYLKKLLSNK